MPDLPAWVDDPVLVGLWGQLRNRLESTGGTPRGRLSVVVTSRDQRHALSALLGKPVLRDRVQVDLTALDRRLTERSGLSGLREVVVAVTGAPLRDRARERAALVERREGPLELARTMARGPWVEMWVDGLRRSGLLTRCADGQRIVTDAVRVVETLAGNPDQHWSRVELGARVLGDAHALDEDTLLHLVVLRALAAGQGIQVPISVTGRRALWGMYGVSSDLLSATCLTLGLRPVGDDGLAARLRTAAATGDPVHVTAWDLRGDPVVVEAGSVFVCENPRVLEAIAQRCAGDVATVCTSGQPNTVVTALLERLVASGCSLMYHGDFDWPGLAIANRLVAQFGVEPWRMTASDYQAGLQTGSPALVGAGVEASWDAELGAAMRAHGRAVHEEAVLDRLLEDLAIG